MSIFKSKFKPAPFCKSEWRAWVWLILLMVLISFGWVLGIDYEKKMELPNFLEKGMKDTVRNLPADFINIANAPAIADQLSPIVENAVVGIFEDVAPTGSKFLGSGVIVHPDGYVLTNRHFVSGAGKLFIQFSINNSIVKLPLEIMKVDATLNVALLKALSTKAFPYLLTALTGSVSPGDQVFAIGKSEASRLLVAPGRIVGPPVTVTIGGRAYPAYKTDATVAGAYSGGPLVNASGRIIGINIAAQKETGAGRAVYHYCIPIAETVDAFSDVITLPRGFDPAGASAMPAARGIKAAAGRFLPIAGYQPKPALFGFHLWDILGLLLIGFFSGLGGGMLTSGGGIIKVSGLVLYFEYGMTLIRPVAYLTNIFIYFVSSRRYHIVGLIKWDLVKRLVPTAILGFSIGYVGGSYTNLAYIKILLAIFAVYSGTNILLELAGIQGGETKKEKVVISRNVKKIGFWRQFTDFSYLKKGAPRDDNFRVANIWYGLPMGLVAGALGISGGVVEVPLQKWHLNIPIRSAIANSSAMAFYCAIFGSVVSMVHGTAIGAYDFTMPFFVSLFIIPGAFFGSTVGAYMTERLPLKYLKASVMVVMYAIALKLTLL